MCRSKVIELLTMTYFAIFHSPFPLDQVSISSLFNFLHSFPKLAKMQQHGDLMKR